MALTGAGGSAGNAGQVKLATIFIGHGGAGASGNTSGRRGAHGYCKLTIGGAANQFTSTGTHYFTEQHHGFIAD